MESLSVAAQVPDTSVHSLSVVRCAATGGVVAALLAVLCWIALKLSLTGATHSYLTLFTFADPGTARALAEAACWSLLFGLATGALVALVYNLTGSLARR